MAQDVPRYSSQIPVGDSPVTRQVGTRVLAGALDQTGDELFQLAAKITARQGELAGQQYGMTTKPSDLQLPDGVSIGEESFTRGAIATGRARTISDVNDNVRRISEEHKGDPDAVRKFTSEWGKGYVDSLPVPLQPIAFTLANDEGDRAYQYALKEQEKAHFDEAAASFVTAEETATNEASTAAFAGKASPAQRLAYLAMLHSHGPEEEGGTGILSRQEIAKRTMAFDEDVKIAGLKGDFERSGNKTAFVERFKADLMSGKSGMDVNKGQALLHSFNSEARSIAAEARSIQTAKLIENRDVLKGRADDQIALARSGEPIKNPISRVEVFNSFAKPADAERAWQELQRETEQAQNVGVVGKLSFADTNALLDSTQPDPNLPGYGDGLRAHSELQRAAAEVNANRLKNPGGEALRYSPPLATEMASGDPARMSGAMRQSIAIQRDVFGLRDDQVEPLPAASAKAIAEQVAAAPTPDEKLRLLLPLTAGLKDDEAGKRVIAQLEGAGLDDAYAGALDAMQRGDVGAAHELISAISMDPKAFPKGDTTIAQINKAVDDQTLSSVAGRLASLTGSTKALAHEKTAIYRLTNKYVAEGQNADDAATKAAKVVRGERVPVVEPETAVVALPKGTKPAEFLAGVEQTRAGLDLSFYTPKRESYPDEGSYQIALRERQRTIADMKHGAVMIEHGDGYGLVDSITGRLIAGPDGKPMQWSLGDVLGAAKRSPGPAVGNPAGDLQ